MGQLVKMVVDDLADVNDRSLLKLRLSLDVKLDSCGVHVSQVPDVVLSINYNNKKLRVHQLLVVWNLVVILLTLTDFEHGSVSLEGEFDVLKLLSVSTDELQVELLVRNYIAFQDHWLSIQNARSCNIGGF